MASTDARPVPKYNTAYRHYFAIRKNDGTLITTWAGADSEVSIDGASFADCTNEATEIGTSGCGYIDLTASELASDSTTLKVTVTNTDALTYVVSLFPETAGDIRVDVTQLGSNTQSATDLRDFADAGYDPATNKVQGVVLCDTTTTNTDQRGTDSAFLAASAPTNFSDLAITASDGYVTAHAESLSTAAKDNVAATVWNKDISGITTADYAGYLLQRLTNYTAGTINADSVFGQIMWNGVGGSEFDRSYDSLGAIRDRGDSAWVTASGFSTHSAADVWGVTTRVLTANTNLNDPTAAAIADAVWDEATSGHTGAGSYGKAVGDGVTAWVTASGFSTHSAADVWGVTTRVLTANTNLNDPTAAAITDAVWDEATSGHTSAGTYGKAVGDGVTTWVTATGFATHSAADVWGVTTRTLSAATTIDTEIADAVLLRNVSNTEGTAGEHTLTTIVLAMLESSVSGSTWTIKETDGSTTHATKTVTTDSGADPITGVS